MNRGFSFLRSLIDRLPRKQATKATSAPARGVVFILRCILASLVVLALCGRVSASENGDSRIYFDVPSLLAEDAVKRLAAQAKYPVLFRAKNVVNVKTNVVTGYFRVSDALDSLFYGTPLRGDLTNQGVIIVSLRKNQEAEEGMSASRNNRGLSKVLSSVSAFVLGGMIANTALAQDGDTEQAVIEDIVVTATKSGETRLQDTPLAITVFGGDELRETGVRDIQDFYHQIPGVSLSENLAGTFFIRGVGTNSVFIGSEQSSTVHLDGVYMARSATNLLEMIDVERIEVLRGPQGTLYGRNSLGGTINILPRQPSNELSARGAVEYGSYNLVSLTGHVSGPIVENKLFVGLSALNTTRDGIVKNVTPPGGVAYDAGDLQNRNTRGGRFALRWLPAEDHEVAIALDGVESDTRPVIGHAVPVDPLGNPALIPATTYSDWLTINLGAAGTSYMNQYAWGLTGKWNWQISSDWRFSSITAYRETRYRFKADADGTDFGFANQNSRDYQDQFSEEINLSGSIGSLDLISGLYYFHETNEYWANIAIFPGTPGEFVIPVDAAADTKAYAAFGQGTYHLTDSLSLTAGARYNIDKKDFSTLGFPSNEKTYKNFTPKVGADLKVGESSLVYFTISKGFKSGGFNLGDASAFNPEEMWAYEAGLKTELFDNRLRANFAGFYYDLKDLQVEAFESTSGLLRIYNATGAKIKGIEAEFAARPTQSLDLNVAVSYLDATYNDGFFDIRSWAGAPAGLFDVSGNRLNHSPKWKINASARHRWDLGDNGEFSAGVEYNWQDQVYFTVHNDPVEGQDSYGLLNASLQYVTEDGYWRLTVYGRNLTDERYTNASFNISPTGVSYSIHDPHTYGIVLNFNY